MTPDTYTIQEVSSMANVSKHTLRFWERELEGIIVPLRTNGGQRRYTSYDLFIIEEIKRFKKKGLSLIDIKKILHTGKDSSSKNNSLEKIDLLADQIAKVVKSTLYNFMENENFQKKS
jgi:MerR family transcriptional regulator, heat shock protein HspR